VSLCVVKLAFSIYLSLEEKDPTNLYLPYVSISNLFLPLSLFLFLPNKKVQKVTLLVYIFFNISTALKGLGFFIDEVSRSHSDTSHSVGLFWTSEWPVSETSTCQHTTLRINWYSCTLRNSKPQFQQACDGRPAP